MDRILPTQRPQQPLAGNQRWRDLLFVHWPIPAQLIQEKLPPGLEVDCHDGLSYIGVVPFMMWDVRPWWLPKFMAFNFLEINVRCYVHHKGEPGVYFLSLDAASWLAVKAARIGWSLPYFHAGMSMSREGERITYSSMRKSKTVASFTTEYEILEPVNSTDINGIEFFLAERYLLFANRRNRLYRGQVHHAPYPLHRARIHSLEQNLIQIAGLEVADDMPALAHYSPGVDVDIFPLYPIKQ